MAPWMKANTTRESGQRSETAYPTDPCITSAFSPAARIADLSDFWYHILMMTQKIFIASALVLGLLGARTAFAYTSPEDVLLNQALYLPPSTRGVEDRVSRQAEDSAARRAREQEILFKDQQPSSASSESAAVHPSADAEGAATALDPESLTADDRELLRTLRLL